MTVELLALICFLIAAGVFAACKSGRVTWADVPLGLLFVTVGFIFHLLHVTGHTFNVN